MKLAQYCLYNSGKDKCTCGAMICLYFGIALFFMKIAGSSPLMNWFLTSWTFRITSFLNLNDYQCYHHLDLSMIKGFHVFVMFSLSLCNSVQQCKGNFTKDTGHKMFISWQTYEGLEISVNWIIEATQFLLWLQVKYVPQNAFVKILSKTVLVGKDI